MEAQLQSTAQAQPSTTSIHTLVQKFREQLLPGHLILTERQEAQKHTPSLCSESRGPELPDSPLWLCTHAVAYISSNRRKTVLKLPSLPHGCSFHLSISFLWMIFFLFFFLVGFPQLILTERPKAIVFLPTKQPDNRSYPPT